IGPDGGDLTAFVQDPTNSNILYVAPQDYPCRIYKSTDNGNTWFEHGQISSSIYSMAIAPSNPSILYGSYYSLYKSTNGGANWTYISLPFSCFIPSIVIDGTDPNLIHLCGRVYQDSQYVIYYFRSNNGGTSWSYEQVSTDYSYPYCMAVDPANSNIIYIGGYIRIGSSNYTELFKSSDGGSSWSSIVSGISGYVRDIEIDPTNSSKVYAGTSGGVYRSTNSGASWTKNNGSVLAYELALDPNNPSTLYAGYSDRIYKSTDSGVNWTKYTTGLFGGLCYDIGVDHGSSSNVFYIANPGFFRSSDGGHNWSPSNAGLLIANINSMTLDPSNPEKMFVGFYNNAMYKTTDATAKAAGPMAVSWERIPPFYSCHNIEAIIIKPTNPDRIVAMEGGS
ncbi:WD40/YVTN/BNR-like repeat-containing protein, partial [bacterium]